jgi:hypothetical protein
MKNKIIKFKEPISKKEKLMMFFVGAFGLYMALLGDGYSKYIGIFLVVIYWGLIVLLNAFDDNQWNHIYNHPKGYTRVLLYANDNTIVSGEYNILISEFIADKEIEEDQEEIIYLYWCEIPYKNLTR